MNASWKHTPRWASFQLAARGVCFQLAIHCTECLRLRTHRHTILVYVDTEETNQEARPWSNRKKFSFDVGDFLIRML